MYSFLHDVAVKSTKSEKPVLQREPHSLKIVAFILAILNLKNCWRNYNIPNHNLTQFFVELLTKEVFFYFLMKNKTNIILIQFVLQIFETKVSQQVCDD
jgi:hypothetical protein